MQNVNLLYRYGEDENEYILKCAGDWGDYMSKKALSICYIIISIIMSIITGVSYSSVFI